MADLTAGTRTPGNAAYLGTGTMSAGQSCMNIQATRRWEMSAHAALRRVNVVFFEASRLRGFEALVAPDVLRFLERLMFAGGLMR